MFQQTGSCYYLEIELPSRLVVCKTRFYLFSLFLQMTKVRKRVGRVAVARAQFSRMNLLSHSRQLTPSSTPIHIQVCSLLTTLLPPTNLDNFSNQKGHGDCFSVSRKVKSNGICSQTWVKDPPQVTSTMDPTFLQELSRSKKIAKCAGLVSLYIQSRMIAPPGWAPLQSKQSVLSLIVLSDWSSLN